MPSIYIFCEAAYINILFGERDFHYLRFIVAPKKWTVYLISWLYLKASSFIIPTATFPNAQLHQLLNFCGIINLHYLSKKPEHKKNSRLHASEIINIVQNHFLIIKDVCCVKNVWNAL